MTDKGYLQYETMLIKIANRFKNNTHGIDIDDIKQIGSLGMIRAFETYKEEKGMSFDTYMYSCISWSVKREFHNLKRIHSQYAITSLYHEIDEGTNMYDIIPNSSVNVESEVLEYMTLQEYIQEFKSILSPTKANIFIDRYVNELQIKDIDINNISYDEYVLFESLYINKERAINIMCKMNISKSTYYDLKKKLIFKISEIIYPKCIRDMYESYLF